MPTKPAITKLSFHRRADPANGDAYGLYVEVAGDKEEPRVELSADDVQALLDGLVTGQDHIILNTGRRNGKRHERQ